MICDECKKNVDNCADGAGVVIFLCDKCTPEDIADYLAEERYEILKKLKEVEVPIPVDREIQEHVDFLLKMDNLPEYPLIMHKIRGRFSNYKAIIDNFNKITSKFEIFEEHDGAIEMNEFLELLDTLEYSYENGRTEEAIVALREKMVNLFREATWRNDARDMSDAPLDGSEILAETNRLGFQIITWSGEDGDYQNHWLDAYGKCLLAEPMKWWSLPEKKEEKKKGLDFKLIEEAIQYASREGAWTQKHYDEMIDLKLFAEKKHD